MRLSRKSDYALRVLLTLTEHCGKPAISIRELAERNDVPKRFLEHIILEMKSKGWVESIPGRFGGYMLAKEPAEITMGEVVRHFDEILAPISCVSVSDYQCCSQEPVCRFRRTLLEIRDLTARMMDKSTLATIHSGEPVMRREVFSEQMIDGAGI